VKIVLILLLSFFSFSSFADYCKTDETHSEMPSQELITTYIASDISTARGERGYVINFNSFELGDCLVRARSKNLINGNTKISGVLEGKKCLLKDVSFIADSLNIFDKKYNFMFVKKDKGTILYNCSK